MNSIGVVGLGTMGKNLCLNLLDKGHSLAVYNRSENFEKELLDTFIKSYSQDFDFDAFYELEDFVSSLDTPRIILLMVKAGEAIDMLIDALLPFLNAGDILIDGGNSHFSDTRKRQSDLTERGIYFYGCGISGGEKGARFGPSIMPGGNQENYKYIADILESVSAKDKSGNACCSYIGPDGAGHYVKMVHNGIEYAEMQLIAELYHSLNNHYSNLEISEILNDISSQGNSSYLLDITISILKQKEGDAYLVDLILDRAGNKGTGAWSSISALELGSVNTLMSEAVFARYISSFKEARVRYNSKLRFERTVNPPNPDVLAKVYRFVSLINHHQGFNLLYAASREFGWNLKLHEIARIWTNGCIIRSQLMQECSTYFQAYSSLLDVPEVFGYLETNNGALQGFLINSIQSCVPLPCTMAAFHYWTSVTSDYLPANLIQAQRDYFGAHTYERIDRENGEFFHTDWDL